MLRLCFMIVVVAVIVGSMMGRFTPDPPSNGGGVLIEAAAAQHQPAAAARAVNRLDGSIALDRNADGHFYADVRINGNSVHMLVDTGASAIALSREDARTAGLAPSIGMPDVVGEGADGAVRGEYVRLDRVELGPLTAEGLDAVVLNSGQQSLLGQSFLSKFRTVQIEGDQMVLR
jgi:aspartyl protease family protein